VAHQTLSGAPGQVPNEQDALGNSLGALRYKSPDCLVCTGHVWWASGATTNWRKGRLQKQTVNWIVHGRVRAQKSEVTGHVGCRTGLSGAAIGQGFQRWSAPKPQRACWRGTHRTVNSDCPVCHQTIRCATGLSGVLIASKDSQRQGSS
jgi:hypothetical protein